jgi:hypothetical protein
VRNYFNYFTEIEERFQQRRGALLLLSTLDWALIETWREAGIPLEAALRGIDAAFDKYDARPQKTRFRRINGLAWCSQAVLEAAQEMGEAAIGSQRAENNAVPERDSGFEAERIAAHLESAAKALEAAGEAVASRDKTSVPLIFAALSGRLSELAAEQRGASLSGSDAPGMEELERTLTVLEEKLFAALTGAAPEALQVEFREQASRELAPYRSRMGVVQLRQVERQFLHKSLLEHYGIPRFSLFYMGHEG